MNPKKTSNKKTKKEEKRTSYPQKKNQLPYLPGETDSKNISVKDIPKG